ncbi:hypothetical protein SUDANB6_05210 [Streptomyces sp. enrichment culture]
MSPGSLGGRPAEGTHGAAPDARNRTRARVLRPVAARTAPDPPLRGPWCEGAPRRHQAHGAAPQPYRVTHPRAPRGCAGPSAGSTPEQVLAACPADATYDYASRPASVHRAVARAALTGRIGKPLITLHGDLDALLPEAVDSDVYARMTDGSGRGGLHRYYTIRGDTHVDGLYDAHPDRLRPIPPCYRSAFDAPAGWVERGTPPPADHTAGGPAGGDAVDAYSLSGTAAAPRRRLSGRVPYE